MKKKKKEEKQWWDKGDTCWWGRECKQQMFKGRLSCDWLKMWRKYTHAYRTTLCRVWHEWLLKRRVEKSRVVIWRRGAALVRLPVTGRDGRPAVTETWDIAAKVRHVVVPALSEGKPPYRTHTKKQIQSHHLTAATHWLNLLKSFPSLRLKIAPGAFETNMSALLFATNNLTRKIERNATIRLNSKIWNLSDPAALEGQITLALTVIIVFKQKHWLLVTMGGQV